MDKQREELLKKLGITFVSGTKSKDDKIYFWNDKVIDFTQLGELYAELCKNEDVNYPHGEGGDYLERFLKRVKEEGGVSDEIKKEFRI